MASLRDLLRGLGYSLLCILLIKIIVTNFSINNQLKLDCSTPPFPFYNVIIRVDALGFRSALGWFIAGVVALFWIIALQANHKAWIWLLYVSRIIFTGCLVQNIWNKGSNCDNLEV